MKWNDWHIINQNFKQKSYNNNNNNNNKYHILLNVYKLKR